MNGAFVCVGIFVMVCHPLNQAPHTATVVDSYCHIYQRIIRNEQDAEHVGRIESRAVRERIAYNETLYRCQCEGWDHAVCRNEAMQAREQVAAQR